MQVLPVRWPELLNEDHELLGGASSSPRPSPRPLPRSLSYRGEDGADATLNGHVLKASEQSEGASRRI